MKKIWILVHVYRGFIQEPEIFADQLSAENRMKKILERFNKDYDEIEIFEKVML